MKKTVLKTIAAACLLVLLTLTLSGCGTVSESVFDGSRTADENSFRKSICQSARNVAMAVDAKAIIVESATGKVARAMAHFRPDCPIIAVVTSTLIQHKLCLSSGVTAVLGDNLSSTDEITKQAMEKALETGIVKKGDIVVVVSSNKIEPSYGTDTLQIRVI